jgi:hypothetical protein
MGSSDASSRRGPSSSAATTTTRPPPPTREKVAATVAASPVPSEDAIILEELKPADVNALDLSTLSLASVPYYSPNTATAILEKNKTAVNKLQNDVLEALKQKLGVSMGGGRKRKGCTRRKKRNGGKQKQKHSSNRKRRSSRR